MSPYWQVEADPNRRSEVEVVRFIAADARRTRVELEHRHLDRHGDGWEGARDGVAAPEGLGALPQPVRRARVRRCEGAAASRRGALRRARRSSVRDAGGVAGASAVRRLARSPSGTPRYMSANRPRDDGDQCVAGARARDAARARSASSTLRRALMATAAVAPAPAAAGTKARGSALLPAA